MNLSDEFKQDIDVLIDSLFSRDEDDTETSHLFLAGVITGGDLTAVESAVLMQRLRNLTVISGVLLMLGKRRDLPMKQFGIYFRRKLRERLQTYILTQAHEAEEKNK